MICTRDCNMSMIWHKIKRHKRVTSVETAEKAVLPRHTWLAAALPATCPAGRERGTACTTVLLAARPASREGGVAPPHKHVSALLAAHPTGREGGALLRNFILIWEFQIRLLSCFKPLCLLVIYFHIKLNYYQ